MNTEPLLTEDTNSLTSESSSSDENNSQETSKLEMAVKALSSNLQIDMPDKILVKIRHVDITHMKLKKHFEIMEQIEQKLNQNMKELDQKVQLIEEFLEEDDKPNFVFAEEFRRSPFNNNPGLISSQLCFLKSKYFVFVANSINRLRQRNQSIFMI